MNALKIIKEVFTMFHDGAICGYTGDSAKLTLKIECLYLAERINPEFDSFFVELLNVETLYFVTWHSEENPSEKITGVQKIFEPELEIISAEIVGNIVEVHCRQDNKQFAYSGGVLHLSCGVIKVLDQDGKEITMDSLISLCKQYWDNLR